MGLYLQPLINTVFFKKVITMTKETDTVIYFCIACVFAIWNSIQVLISMNNAVHPILKVKPEKRTPTQLKRMLKNDLVELVLQYQ